MSPLALSRPPRAGRPLPRLQAHAPSLAESLGAFAETHGFIGGLYVHLGHAQAPVRQASQPSRIVATAGFEGRIDLRRLDFEHDPLLARAVRSLTPFAWTLSDLSMARQGPFVRHLAWWGVQAGVVAPVHHHAFGPAFLNLFVREADSPREDFAALMLAAAQFHVAATTTAPASAVPDRSGLLSSREIAVLRLAALGRTEQETAEALRLSRRTIQYHLASAVEKLGTPNKTAAVARAVGSGLIVLPTEELDQRTRLVR